MTEMLLDENVLLLLLFFIGLIFHYKCFMETFSQIICLNLFFFEDNKDDILATPHTVCTESGQGFLLSKGKFFIITT